MMLTWRDKDESLHSIPLMAAVEVLKRFYADWPGGFAEIESALRTAANRAAKLDVSPNTKTTPCPTCSAPCNTKVLMRGGDHGWGTTDLERTQYSYAGAPKQVAGVERTFGYWQTHPEHEPLGDHSMVPLTDADKADGWTEMALGPVSEKAPNWCEGCSPDSCMGCHIPANDHPVMAWAYGTADATDCALNVCDPTGSHDSGCYLVKKEPAQTRKIGVIRFDHTGHPYAVLQNCYDNAGNAWTPETPIYEIIAHTTPECLTCNDQGAVGNILTAEPCPDCTPTAQADSTPPVQGGV